MKDSAWSLHNHSASSATWPATFLESAEVLRSIAMVTKAYTQPPLNNRHKLKCQQWANKYLKMNFSKVLWTYNMRVTLYGPDGWARGWIIQGHNSSSQVSERWNNGVDWHYQRVGQFRKMQTCCSFLEDTFKRTMIFMQDNTPSYASKYSTAGLAS